MEYEKCTIKEEGQNKSDINKSKPGKHGPTNNINEEKKDERTGDLKSGRI